MPETYYVGAYWGYRPEPAEQCARRAETFVRLLSGCHDTYARWYQKQCALEPPLGSAESFFGSREEQREEDGLGANIWSSQVEQGQGGMLMLRCGQLSMASPNSIVLHLPSVGAEVESLLSVPVLTGVMRAMVMAWEPDWAIALSDQFRDKLSHQGTAGTFLGWLTYLSRQRGEVPALPEPVRVEPVEGKGTLLVLGPERLCASNPEHVALGQCIQHVLKKHDLLRRLRPRRR